MSGKDKIKKKAEDSGQGEGEPWATPRTTDASGRGQKGQAKGQRQAGRREDQGRL